MKKITLAVSGLVLLAGSAFADSTNIGAKLSYGNFDASGTETQNLASDPKINSSGNAKFPFASIFLEREKEFTNLNVALGLDFIPLTAEIDKLGGGDGTDATVEVGNQITLYVQPSKELSNGLKVFGKLGYSRMTVDISEIKRQPVTNGSGTASTDKATSKDLDGVMVGLGIEKSVSAGPFDFIRLEASYTDYDSISHTNSNSKKLTADADLTAISLSIGKKF